MSYHIELIGIAGMEPASGGRHALEICDTVVASTRHRPLIEGMGRPIIPIAPVKEMLHRLKEALYIGHVAVLASGDPFFFGVGRTLINKFGQKTVNIHPALSSMQLACARFRIPWDDMTFMSLHGRERGNTAARILRCGKSAIFTDQGNSPDGIAEAIVQRLSSCNDVRLLEGIKVFVAENLGLEQERLITGTLEEIATQAFSPMNIMIVQQPEDKSSAHTPMFGLKEDEISHSRGLITKDEVRAVTLHALRLPAQGCFWDIGAGSGSVSVEAALLYPDLTVWSVEKNGTEQVNITKNIKKFGCYNINLIKGEAPGLLMDLPAPNAVFIGGSGGRLADIVEQCAARLLPGGRMVINAVLEETARRAPALMAAEGLEITESIISVSRKTPGRDAEKLNPITVIIGKK